jgi:glycolate oxidase iron-sulfur subunit
VLRFGGHLNILEPEIAARLRDRKIANIVQTSPDLVATGNIGCIAQIASGTSIPVLHTIELLDFAHGGPTPDDLRAKRHFRCGAAGEVTVTPAN